MYKQIKTQKPVLQKYAEKLISEGVVTRQEYEVRLQDVHKHYNRTQFSTRRHEHYLHYVNYGNCS